MRTIKFSILTLSIALLLSLSVALSLNQQAMGTVDQPNMPSIHEAVDALDASDAGALKSCYLWCVIADASPGKVNITMELLNNALDSSGHPITGTIHFILVSASTNITTPVLRTSPLPGRLVTPTITQVGNATVASHEFDGLEAGGYQIVTLVTPAGLGVPGNAKWDGYAFWGLRFNVSKFLPPTRSNICSSTGCLNTQMYLNGRMSINGTITGTQNGAPIQGDINIFLMPAKFPLLLDSPIGDTFNLSPLPGKLFTPTVSNIAGGRAFTVELKGLVPSQWRTVRLVTLGGTIGKSDWDGLFTWVENTMYAVQYLPSVLNNQVGPEPEPTPIPEPAVTP